MRHVKGIRTGSASEAEKGQVLILFVLMLAVLMGFTALAIDVGLFMHERRQAQSAADAAALAAVRELPLIPQADSVAREYAKQNGFDPADADVTIEVTTPYNGNVGAIEVRVSREMDFLFGRVLGLTSVEVSARAVAQVTSGDAYAIFVINNSCAAPDPLLEPSSSSSVSGAVHSNSTAQISGSNNSFNGAFTYTCSFQNGGQNNTFNPPPAQSGTLPSPLNYNYSSFPCTYSFTQDTNLNSVQEVWVGGNPSSNQLLPGVYCSTTDIQLSGANITGNVTLVAQDEVKISGSNFNLTGYWNDVLAFSAASHDSAIDMSGSGGQWTGFIHAPNGRIKVAGSGNLSIAGSLVSNRVTVSGSDFSLDSAGLSVPPSVRLVE